MGVWSSAVQGPHRTGVEDRIGYARAGVRAHAAAAAMANLEAGHDLDGYDNAGATHALPGRAVPGSEVSRAQEPEAVIHLLCDLMHLAMDLEVDFSALLGSAEHHFVEERLLR